MAAKQSWKEWAGRDTGGDHYHVGDISRHLWKKVTGGGSASSSSSPVMDADRAVLDLKVQRDQLVGHRRRFETQVGKDDEAARTMVKSGKKTQAMLALRKKKHHEQLALDTQTHINRLEELIANIEFTQVQNETIQALGDGVKMLKKLQQATGGVDYINRLMDDCAEATADQQEISDSLAASGVAADDLDALAEYERLVEAQAAEKLQETAAPPQAAPQETAAPAPAVAAPEAAPAVESSAIGENAEPASKIPVEAEALPPAAAPAADTAATQRLAVPA